MNSIEILDAIKKKYGIKSDRQAATKLGVSQRWVSKIRTGEAVFGADTMYEAGKLLGIDEGKIACWAMAERAKTDAARRAWQRGYADILLLSTIAAPALAWILTGNKLLSAAAITIHIMLNSRYSIRD